mmetsp:Transcript_41187/g.94734  ORF Transcript_41187/g.94734 Transcript_41187/m.94734 type:complete len:210 (-) Transcript_41187:101-730(-)
MLGKHQSKCHRFRPLILACGFAVTLLGPRTFLCPQITRAHLQRPQVLRHALSVDAILEDGQDAEAVSNVAQEANGGQEEGKHVLLVVLDDNPYLSGSTKAALKHAAIGAKAGNKVTAMVLPGTPDGNLTNPEVLVNTLRWWFEENEVPADRYEELVPSVNMAPAALVADAVEELECDQVVISAEAVAKKRIDIPLLATFLGCPMLLVPE